MDVSLCVHTKKGRSKYSHYGSTRLIFSLDLIELVYPPYWHSNGIGNQEFNFKVI